MKWHRVEALLLKYWYMMTGEVDRVFDMFYWPFLSIVVFGITAGFIESISDDILIAKSPSVVPFWLISTNFRKSYFLSSVLIVEPIVSSANFADALLLATL